MKLANENSFLSPSLVYDQDAIEENLALLVKIAGDQNRLWPHVKSHKCAELVKLLMQHGISRFKCATIAEAEMTAQCGAAQALLAYPLVGPNIARFVQLVKTYEKTTFYAIGDDEKQLELLAEEAVRHGVQVHLLIDVNDGLKRTGIPVRRAEELYRRAARMPGLKVQGMHVYDGHRHEKELSVRQQLVDQDLQPVFAMRNALVADGLDCSIMVMGGTPSFPCHAQYPDVYLSPGTALLQDAQYQAMFPDLAFKPAAFLLTRVISHPEDGYFTMDLGTKSVASDPKLPRAILLGYEEAETIKHNEEHWVLRMPEGQEDRRPPIGGVLYAVPKHVCPTSALYGSVLVAQKGEIVGEWAVTARDRKIGI